MHTPLTNLQQTQLRVALDEGIRRGFTEALGNDFDRDIRKCLESIKMGEEAEEHTGSSGCLAYFCTEETCIPTLYLEAVSAYWKWEEAIQETLRPLGFFMENINSCELSVWRI